MELLTFIALVGAPVSVAGLAIAIVVSFRRYSKRLETHTDELLKGLGFIRDQTDPNMLSKALHERMNTTDGVSKLLAASANAQERIGKAVILHSKSVKAIPKQVSDSITTAIPKTLESPVQSFRQSVAALSDSYNVMGKTLADSTAQFVAMVQTLRDQDDMRDIGERVDQAVASILGAIESIEASFDALQRTSTAVEAIAAGTQETWSCLREQAEALTTQNELYGTNEELFHSSITTLFENHLRLLHESQQVMQNTARDIADTVRGDHEVRELLQRSFPSLFQAHERSTQRLAALVPDVEKLCVKYQETLDSLVENWQKNQGDMLKDFHEALAKTREPHLALLKRMKSDFKEVLEQMQAARQAFFADLGTNQEEMIRNFRDALSDSQGAHSEFLSNLRKATNTYVEGLRKETDVNAEQHAQMIALQAKIAEDYQHFLNEHKNAFRVLPQIVAKAVAKGTHELLRDSKSEIDEVKTLVSGIQAGFKDSIQALNRPATMLAELSDQQQRTHESYRKHMWALLVLVFIAAIGGIGQIVLCWLAIMK